MADDNWKERLGFEINYTSSEDDERINGSDELSPLSPLNGEGSGGLMDAIIRDYDAYGTTPPRTRILRRNRDRNRKEKEGQSISKSSAKTSPRVVYAGRSSFDKNMYKKSEPPPNDNFDGSFIGGDSRRSSNANKRNMQRLRGSERDLKLDLSSIRILPPKEERAESLPPQPVLKVQSCNRFMSLSSKLVACQHFGLRSNFQPPTTQEECSQSRVEFYQTFSLLIKMGNVEKQGEIPCKRQLSREEHLWQNELKEVIWLELQAWHAGRTLKEQDDYLFEARKNVEQVLLDIINYRFKKRPDRLSAQSSDSGIHIPPVETDSEADPTAQEEDDKGESNPCNSCVSLFCPYCMEQQNCALKDVENLLFRLEAAEGLFPSSKAFAQQYPLYRSPQFIGRVKAMCLWYNMTKRHRLKLLILGKHLLCHAESKVQTWSSSSSSNSSSNTNSEDISKLPSPDHSDSNFPGYMMTLDYYNTQSIAKISQYFQHLKTDENRVYRKYIEDVLKTRGLRKALNFLEKLHTSVLRKATITLEKPADEVDIGYPQTGVDLDLPEEAELKRYGFWSQESQALGLPSYRACYLFMSRIPLDIIHEFLCMRLETKPERPSSMSIRQLIRELKEGLSLAVVSRERYLSNVQSALWDTEPVVIDTFKSQVALFDASVQSVLEVYLDYLQQWVQMIQQERVQKNILKEEWTFINKLTPHIPGGQALVGSSFCRMASSMLRAIREQFKHGVEELTDNITPEAAKLAKLSIRRELQVLCTETREKALSVVALAKTVRKDLESEDSNRSSLCCNIIADSLAQLKREAISMCNYISNAVVQVDQTIQVLEDWEGTLREVLHQFFKFGFEYHKEVCWVVTGGCRSQLSRGLITFAQQWMVFAKQRCERGRGLRPRWANHGFDFLMTICEPHFTNCLTDEEFEELKTNIDECISHVIGTAVPSSSGTTTPPASYYSRSRGVSPSPSPAPRTPKPVRHDRSLSTPPNPDVNGYKCDLSSYICDKESSPIPELEVPILKNLSKSERVLEAINKLDDSLESRLKTNDLIGNVVVVTTLQSERNFIKPRPVTFGWQRGIKIGQGRFGKVYTAVNNETGELMAMKEIALQPNDHRTIRSVALELKIFEGIQHENLVRYYGVEIHREEMLIFMELCTEGTLESLVAATESGLPEALIRRYSHQLVTAVNTLHQHSIVHRDIKSANIFLTAEGNCLKLGDFGSAVKIKAHTTVPGELQGFVGTQAYMAPEVFMKTNQEGHGRAVDVWSLGCVLVEMGSGKRPWADFDSNYQIMFKVGMGEIPAIPESLSEEGQNFASLCLVHDPKERATTAELINHTFLVVDNDEECLSFAMPSMLENYLKLGIKR